MCANTYFLSQKQTFWQELKNKYGSLKKEIFLSLSVFATILTSFTGFLFGVFIIFLQNFAQIRKALHLLTCYTLCWISAEIMFRQVLLFEIGVMWRSVYLKVMGLFCFYLFDDHLYKVTLHQLDLLEFFFAQLYQNCGLMCHVLDRVDGGSNFAADSF